MVEVPGGSFPMGWDLGEINERPEHEVHLATFRIDRYEVSAVEFAEFLNRKGNPNDLYFSQDRYSTIEIVTDREGNVRYAPRDGYDSYPANNVSWFGAEAYCRDVGKRLPTEAEWEKAARGEDKRMYPWGNDPPDQSRARYGLDWNAMGVEVMVPVSALPDGASYYGAYNMAGNVWEWTNDWYRQNYCNYCGDFAGRDEITVALTGLNDESGRKRKRKNRKNQTPPRDNPAGPETGSFKVLRGGSWYDAEGAGVVRSTFRFWFTPQDKYLNTGFRCAK